MQKKILEQPLSGDAFLSGPAGSGKSTVGVQRMLQLINSGINANSILILTPQKSLSKPYTSAIQESSHYSGSQASFMTIGSIARKVVDLFWPFAAEYGGFTSSSYSPVFLSLETAQYHMAKIVRPLLDEGYFSSVVIDRNRLYSQILDNLNKSAFTGFPHSEIGSRLNQAWAGETSQRRIFSDVQDCANRFREYCFENNLVDYSLLMEIFVNTLWPLPIVQNYFNETYRHLIYDNPEEDTPIAHDLVLQWLPKLDSSMIIQDDDGGHRQYLGADPISALRLKDASDVQFHLDRSFVMSEEIENLANKFTQYFSGNHSPKTGSTKEKTIKIPVSFPSETRFFPQMLDWVSREVLKLIHEDGLSPADIAIMVPFLSDSLRFSIINNFESLNIPIRSLRPSRSLRDEPASRAILTLAKLCHPTWEQVPSIFDITQLLFFCIQDFDLVRSQLLSEIVYRQKGMQLSSFDIIKADIQERITYLFGNRYEIIRKWVEDYRQSETQPLDHFIRRLFGEILSQPGFGFHQNPDASRTTSNLIESIKNFRIAMMPGKTLTSKLNLELGLDYINLLNDGVLAAQYAESWYSKKEETVLLAPAHTFLMMNQPVSVQFWLDPGSSSWFERLNQPLTHPYVLSRNWETNSSTGHILWTDADEITSSQASLARFVSGLLHRCKQHIYLGISNYSENGFEQQGNLLKAFQRVFQTYL